MIVVVMVAKSLAEVVVEAVAAVVACGGTREHTPLRNTDSTT